MGTLAADGSPRGAGPAQAHGRAAGRSRAPWPGSRSHPRRGHSWSPHRKPAPVCAATRPRPGTGTAPTRLSLEPTPSPAADTETPLRVRTPQFFVQHSALVPGAAGARGHGRGATGAGWGRGHGFFWVQSPRASGGQACRRRGGRAPPAWAPPRLPPLVPRLPSATGRGSRDGQLAENVTLSVAGLGELEGQARRPARGARGSVGLLRAPGQAGGRGEGACPARPRPEQHALFREPGRRIRERKSHTSECSQLTENERVTITGATCVSCLRPPGRPGSPPAPMGRLGGWQLASPPELLSACAPTDGDKDARAVFTVQVGRRPHSGPSPPGPGRTRCPGSRDRGHSPEKGVLRSIGVRSAETRT